MIQKMMIILASITVLIVAGCGDIGNDLGQDDFQQENIADQPQIGQEEQIPTTAPSEAGMGNTVSVHYTLTLEDGSVADSSLNMEPLTFTIGAQQMIPGFEQAIIGMSVGETKEFSVPSSEAYGEYDPALVETIAREDLGIEEELEEGMMLQMMTETGMPTQVEIVEVTDETITIDLNHPLAGETLYFDVEVISIQ
ncbi:MAG: FKBP-type peptidyl-prolyl cis-trans isomerase [Candidatus Woesearchaeota archaeon]